MLKKLSDFVVEKRIYLLTIMLILALVSVFCASFVKVNEDMTKYLPDDSNMKVGMDIMAEAFPEMEMSNTIRVMFDDLTDTQKAEVFEQLTAIEHVDSVDHDPVSADYNKDNHTLYIINMSCDYNSAEEKAIETVLTNQFSDYKVAWQNDDTSSPTIPTSVIIVVMIILFAILFTTCGSWLDPFLFLVTIGIAVLINAGTNIFLGTIAGVTNSIASLLQMVLSMDYSIIMMNRYRQERKLDPDKKAAMKRAWVNAFSSVSSSSLTTVVGLLMLVFMSFKIGTDLGIVLAKGVFISMICVLTILPALITIFDQLLIKTAKKELHVSMNWAAKFSHKLRFPLTAIFLIMFVAFYIWQSYTGIAYTLVKDDAVADVFPKSNMLVMIYDKQDEDQLGDLLTALDEDSNVTSVMGYGTILGKPYTSDKLVEVIEEMSDDVTLNSAMIDMLYYHYYTGGEVGTMTVSEFLSFVSEKVVNDDTFSDYIDDDMMDKVDLIGKFADAEALQKPLTASDLAEIFDIDAASIADLFLLYQIENNSAVTDSMTLAAFADFIINDVALNPTYSAMFDAATVSQLSQLSAFTDAEKMTAPCSYEAIASLLGMEAEQAKLLFVYYHALSDSYNPGTMTLPEFVSFLKNVIALDPVFSAYIDQSSLAQIDALSAYTDKQELQMQRDPAALASMLGIDESIANTIFMLHNAQDVSSSTMTLAQFTGFLNSNLLSDPMFAGSFDEETTAQLQTMDSLIQLAASKQGLSPAQMSQILGMDESVLKQLYYLYFSTNAAFLQEAAATTMSFQNFLALLKANTPAEQQAALAQMEQLIALAGSNTKLTAAELAAITGMPENQVALLFVQPVEKMTFAAFLNVATTMAPDNVQLLQLKQLTGVATSGTALTAAELAAITGMPEASISMMFAAQGIEKMTLAAFLNTATMMAPTNVQLQQLKQLISAASSNTALTAAELAAMTGMEEAQVSLLFVQPVDKVTLAEFLTTATAMAPDNTQLQQLQQLILLSASSTPLNAATLANVFGIDQMQVFQLISLHLAGQKTIPLASFTTFLVQDVMGNEAFSASFSEEQKAQLSTMNQLVQLAASGMSLNAATLAKAFGMEESLATIVFRLYSGSDITAKTMSLEETIDFILADPVMSGYMGDESITQLQMMQQLITATVMDVPFTPDTLSRLLGMDSSSLKMLFTVHASETQLNSWALSMQTIVQFLVSNKETVGSMMDSEQFASLSTAQTIIDGAVDGTTYTAAEICSLTGMTEDQARQLYLLHTSKYGDTSGWNLSIKSFIDFVVESVLPNKDYADKIDADMTGMVTAAKAMVDAVIANEEHTAAEMSDIFKGLTDELDVEASEMLYLYAESLENADPTWTMTLESLFNHLVDHILNDARFAAFIDEDMKAGILDNQATLADGKQQLVGDQYARLIIYTTYLEESAGTTEFIKGIEEYARNNFDGTIYLVGSSAMAYEMQQIFDTELTFITLLTALAIFLIVALTFRSVSVPLILVLLVQCGVYITVTVTGITSGEMYFLALLIVECILMGATIDYGILFTNYYCEHRRTTDKKEALKKAYDGSIHTIMTSGMILVLVTAAIGGMFEDATVSAIVRTISIGSFCAIMLILFILPGLLAACDKLIIKKANRFENTK